MEQWLKILMLAGNTSDARLIEQRLKEEYPSLVMKLTMNREDYLASLEEFEPDIILSDNSVGDFGASEALQLTRRLSLDLPFILLANYESEELASSLMRQGADDYIYKDRLGRLPIAIEASLTKKGAEEERNDAIRLLIESEEKYRTFVQYAFDGIIIYSPTGKILECNHSACSYLGYSEEELKQLTIYDLFFPGDLQKTPIHFNALKTGQPTLDYRRIRRKDGSELHMEIGTKMMPDGKLMAIGRDITDRKKAEDKIRLSNERYETVAKATSDGIWDYDFVTGRTYIAGTGYKYLFGYDIVNDYSEEGFWESRIHPDDKDRVLSELNEALSDPNREQSQSEYRFLKADGTYAYVHDRFFIIRENGKPVKMLGAKQDITTRKKAEEELKKSYDEKRSLAERLSAILNTVPADIALLDDKGVIIDVNDSWRSFTERNDFAGIGDNYIDISRASFGNDPQHGNDVAEGLQSVLTNNIREFVYEYSFHSPAGRKWFRMVAAPFMEKGFTGAVVMHIDISELRRLEQERLESRMEEQKKITRAMMHAQEKERTELGQELHDNISQLLIAIKMKLAFAIRHYDRGPSNLIESMEHVQEAIAETRSLSHRMVMPRFAENSFKQALEQLTVNYNDEQRKVKLETNKLEEKKIPALIKETLYRITQEQLSNIEKHANATEVIVSVVAEPDQISLSVKDNGRGFDVRKKKTGIGLTNIFNRVESYNGYAVINSEPGKGCILKVHVPLHRKIAG